MKAKYFNRLFNILYFPFLLLIGFGITFLDIEGVFIYIPYWIVSIAILIIISPKFYDSAFYLRLFACLALILWIWVILPQMKWTHLKSFYVDCQNISEGMTFEEADNVMSAYHLAFIWNGDGKQHPPGEEELLNPHRLYHPTTGGSADWCTAFTKGSRVVGIGIYPD